MTTAQISRRAVLKASGAFGAGAFMLPFWVPQARSASAALTAQYLRIEPSGMVFVTCPVAELGQGTSTGIAMVLADALDADWRTIRFELASVAPQFRNKRMGGMQLTGASTGISSFQAAYAEAGAQARDTLIAAAAQRWRVSPDRCSTRAGAVVLQDTPRSLSYGELAATAAQMPVRANSAPSSPRRRSFVGANLPRLDIAAKVNGSAQYAVDVRLPRMLYATVAHAPAFDGTLAGDRRAEILQRRGVRQVVDLPSAVGVVADRWWIAHRAVQDLAAQWSTGARHAVSDETISAQLRQAVSGSEGAVAKRQGDPDAAFATAERRLAGLYEVPFLAHATMEPMSCVARVGRGSCDIWVCSQLPDRARDVAAKALGLPVNAVKIHAMFGGGGFGRRQEPDVVLQAVLLAARFPGRPVKLIWSREEDVRHDFYRPACVSEMSAAIQGGKVTALRHRQASPSILPRMYPAAMPHYDRVAADGIFPLYAFPNQDAIWVRSETHVPCGMWRSVGASQTIFAIESFIDELAGELRTDPLAFRREMLRGNPRAVAALERMAQLTEWTRYAAPGRALGLAISHKNGDCLVAQCAEVSLDGDKPVVHRVWTVADPGEAIHPDAVRAQLEGAAIWGMTAALYGRISIRQGSVQEGNFDTYPMLRMAETPEFITDIINSGAPIEGTGEGGAPGIAPAISNALAKLTGRRIRRLPLVPELERR